MFPYKEVKTHRKFSNVDAIQIGVHVRTERNMGDITVTVNCSNDEYRDGRYRNIVKSAISRDVKRFANDRITAVVPGNLHVCLDGRWHEEDMSEWEEE